MLTSVNGELAIVVMRGSTLSFTLEVELGDAIAVYGGDSNGLWVENSCLKVGDRCILRIPHNECNPVIRSGSIRSISAMQIGANSASRVVFDGLALTKPFTNRGGYLSKMPDVRGFFWKGATSQKPASSPSPSGMRASTKAGSAIAVVKNGDLSIGDLLSIPSVGVRDSEVLACDRSNSTQKVLLSESVNATVDSVHCDRVVGSVIEWQFTQGSESQWLASPRRQHVTRLPSSDKDLYLGKTEFYLCCGSDSKRVQDSAIVTHVLSVPTYLAGSNL